jgi:hypothetical protein
LQIGEDFGDFGCELDARQASADDRDASTLRRRFQQRLVNAGDGAELDRQRVLADTFDAVDVDVRAKGEHCGVELDPLAAELEYVIGQIHLLDDADAQLDTAAA